MEMESGNFHGRDPQDDMVFPRAVLYEALREAEAALYKVGFTERNDYFDDAP